MSVKWTQCYILKKKEDSLAIPLEWKVIAGIRMVFVSPMLFLSRQWIPGNLSFSWLVFIPGNVEISRTMKWAQLTWKMLRVSLSLCVLGVPGGAGFPAFQCGSRSPQAWGGPVLQGILQAAAQEALTRKGTGNIGWDQCGLSSIFSGNLCWTCKEQSTPIWIRVLYNFKFPLSQHPTPIFFKKHSLPEDYDG